MELDIIVTLFAYSFLLNVAWEFLHSRLYTTCLNQSWKENVPLLLKMAVKDGLWIIALYIFSVFLFGNWYIFDNDVQLTVFLVLALIVAAVTELVSLKLQRWEYARTMPTIGGIGLTPFFELAVTGFFALLMTFYL